MSSFKFRSMRFKLKLVIRLESKVINVKITFCFFSVFFSFWQSQRPPSWICRNEMFLKPAQSHAQSFVFSKKHLNILLLLLHRFQKVPFSSVYARPESPKTISFSNFSTLKSVFKFSRSHRKRYHRFHRFRVNRRPKRKNIIADSLTPVSCKRGLKGAKFHQWQRENLKSWYQSKVEDAYEETN